MSETPTGPLMARPPNLTWIDVPNEGSAGGAASLDHTRGPHHIIQVKGIFLRACFDAYGRPHAAVLARAEEHDDDYERAGHGKIRLSGVGRTFFQQKHSSTVACCQIHAISTRGRGHSLRY